MVIWVSAHIGNAHGESVTHADYAKLRDGILLEEFGDEVGGVADG